MPNAYLQSVERKRPVRRCGSHSCFQLVYRAINIDSHETDIF